MRIILLAIVVTTSLHALAGEEAWVADARKVAGTLPPRLLQVLTDEEVAKGGPEAAIAVCREKAPQIAGEVSAQSGWAIRRVSLRNRNPKAVPDAWERAALEDFDRRAAAGENPATLEKAEMVTKSDGKEYRYMRALPVQQICLPCHGAADKLSPAVMAQLHKLYPEDKGAGYAIGQIRGAITIRKAQ